MMVGHVGSQEAFLKMQKLLCAWCWELSGREQETDDAREGG